MIHMLGFNHQSFNLYPNGYSSVIGTTLDVYNKKPVTVIKSPKALAAAKVKHQIVNNHD